MIVLVEVSQQNDAGKVQQIWNLLSELYSANSSLSQLAEDRRNSHAAELVIAAWRAHQNKHDSGKPLSKPEFVTHLETLFSESRDGSAEDNKTKEVQQANTGRKFESMDSESFLPELEADAIFDLDFQDVDWSFWNSFD